jgi:hypothetical protein
LRRPTNDPAILSYVYTRSDEHLARIGDELASFGGVTRGAGVEKIVVGTISFRMEGDWHEMVNVKAGSHSAPLLTQQAIHAPKFELVAKPGSVTVEVSVT